MTRPISLSIVEKDGSRTAVSVHVQEVLLAGYTGRNRDDVLAHIRELQRIDIAPPPHVPMVYSIDPELLTHDGTVSVNAEQTSGEVEFYLVPSSQGLLVGVASDHTDRNQEAIDVASSKRLCRHPVSREVWRYDDIRDHWDAIELRSRAVVDGKPQSYQDGRLDAFMTVDALVHELACQGHRDLEGRILFGGTIPTTDGFVYASRFEAELHDPLLRRTLTCAYDVELQGQ
jgi:hypothetical protein